MNLYVLLNVKIFEKIDNQAFYREDQSFIISKKHKNC